MAEGFVDIRFDDGREGIIPTGCYLIDAAGRFGVKSILDCKELGSHDCAVDIQEGSELLSEISDAERAQLPEDSNRKTRLACFAKIEKPGVIVAMVKQKKSAAEAAAEEKKAEEQEDAYRKEFEALPLEKKIHSLVKLEAIAFSETVAFVINSPFEVFGKIGDVLAEFGFQKEEAEKAQKRPAEEAAKKNGEASGAKKKGKAKSTDQKSP
jgi:ferredoxin